MTKVMTSTQKPNKSLRTRKATATEPSTTPVLELVAENLSLPAAAEIKKETPTLPRQLEIPNNTVKPTVYTPNYHKKPSTNLDGDINKPDGCNVKRIGTFGLYRRDYTNATKRLILFSPQAYLDLSLLSIQKKVTTDEMIRLLVDAEIAQNKLGYSLIETPKY